MHNMNWIWTSPLYSDKPKVNGQSPMTWRGFDQDLHAILGRSVWCSTTTKLNLFGSNVYGEDKERFREMAQRKKNPRKIGRYEQEICKVVRERRLLRSWRKADGSKKEDLKVLWDQIRNRLTTLRKAECIQKWRSKQEKERVRFFRDPFIYACSLLEEKKSGKLEATEQELEDHIKHQLGDWEKNIPLGSPGHVPRPTEPAVECHYTTQMGWSQANGTQSKVYLCTRTEWCALQSLQELSHGVKAILEADESSLEGARHPHKWSQAVTTFIRKEQHSCNINQFRGTTLLNVEGKIYSSPWWASIWPTTSWTTITFDTSCQKAGVPGSKPWSTQPWSRSRFRQLSMKS